MPPLVTVSVKIEKDDRREYDQLVKRLGSKASHVDIGVFSLSGEGLVVIASANEFGATINHPGGQPYIIVDETKTAKQQAGMSRDQRSARVPLEGGKVLIFLKKGKKGMGVTKPHTIIIPARSFIRSTMDMRNEFYNAQAQRAWNKVLDGHQDVKQALSVLGLQVQSDIQNTIRMLKDPPNTFETARRKGSDNPLIDTGALIQAIRFAVKNDQDQTVEMSP